MFKAGTLICLDVAYSEYCKHYPDGNKLFNNCFSGGIALVYRVDKNLVTQLNCLDEREPNMIFPYQLKYFREYV